MYEDGKKSLSLNWKSLLIKLVILALIIFLVGWIIVRVTGNKNPNSKNTLAASNDYITNITAMKNAAFEYYTASKLPEKVGGSEKLTLSQMINQKLLIDFTNDGKTCDNNNSYVQATKTADGNYALKVSLTCGEKSDFIVTTIEDPAICAANGTCPTNDSKTNTDVVISTDKNSSSNNNTTTTTTTKPVTTTNSSSSTNKATTTSTVTNTVKISMDLKFSCTNCDTTDNNTSTTTPTKPTDTKKLMYKLVRWSDWKDGKSNNSEDENKKTEVATYNYCKQTEKTYYSTSYVIPGTKASTYTYEIQFVDSDMDPDKIVKGSIDIDNESYFSSSTTDYQNYIDERGTLWMSNSNGSANSTIRNASTFRASSLKRNNFDFSVSNITLKGNTYRTKVTIDFNNYNGVTPYMDYSLGYKVYYVPIKFDVTYANIDNCKRDLADNSSRYKGYIKTDKEYETTWIHRSPEYKWSETKNVSGWNYTGISEYR